MACYLYSLHQTHFLRSSFHCLSKSFSTTFRKPSFASSSTRLLLNKGYSSHSLDAVVQKKIVISSGSEKALSRNAVERAVNVNNGRVMLIDGTSIMYRAYYKLLAKLHHGYLTHADGNGDWVLTIFTALSLVIDVLEILPSHVAVVFDHDGVPFGHTSLSPKQSVTAKGFEGGVVFILPQRFVLRISGRPVPVKLSR